MGWSFWLSLAVIVSVLFVMFGLKPRGARPAASTRLVTIARVVLGIVIVLLFYLTFRARAGH